LLKNCAKLVRISELLDVTVSPAKELCLASHTSASFASVPGYSTCDTGNCRFVHKLDRSVNHALLIVRSNHIVSETLPLTFAPKYKK
jgi:hypothetical protein